MIGRIQGKLIGKKPPEILLDVQGIAYEITVPMSTYYKLGGLGETTVLLTHFQVREDAQVLFGFASQKEKDLFRALIKVSGIGPKVALAILSGMEVQHFVNHVIHNDMTSLTKIPGIGKKTAERLIIEMRDKFKDFALELNIETKISPQNQTMQEAISALVALGYKPQEASRAIAKLNTNELNSEQLIKAALKQMLPTS